MKNIIRNEGTLKNNKTTGLRAPFAWVGGKNQLAKKIIPFMPEHEIYVEVFGGALSVFYQKEPSKKEIVNDINSDLINLHKIIRSKPESLKFEINNILKSRELFNDIKNGVLKPRNDIQRAAFYFYLITMSFGSRRKHFGLYKKDRAVKNIYRDFFVYSKRLKHAIIENLPYERIIKEYDYSKTLFYLDPPYAGTEKYYKMINGFTMKDHENLAEILKNIDGKFILSYNDCEFIRELYKGFNINYLKTTYSLNTKSDNRPTAELLITNF